MAYIQGEPRVQSSPERHMKITAQGSCNSATQAPSIGNVLTLNPEAQSAPVLCPVNVEQTTLQREVDVMPQVNPP